MNKQGVTAIVYTSNTGFTRAYAELLGEKTGLPVYDLNGSRGPEKGAAVLYLGWLCAGKLKGLKKAVQRYKVDAVCAVGMGDNETNRPERLAPTLGYRPGPNFFYLRGGYAPGKLSGVYKLMMGMMEKALSRKDAVDEAGKQMLLAFQNGGDWVRAENLVPVLAYLGVG